MTRHIVTGCLLAVALLCAAALTLVLAGWAAILTAAAGW